MRRLLTWIFISIICFTIPILGGRVVPDVTTPNACVQLLDPITGSVLTADANTGRALLDARSPFPMAMAQRGQILRSPDQTHVIETVYPPSGEVQFWLGKRSTAKRHLLTSAPAEHYRWSPNSHYVAFTEVLRRTNKEKFVTLTVAEVGTGHIFREIIPNGLDNSWDWGIPTWSPDSTLVALPIFSSVSGNATLVLRSVEADQSIYVPLFGEQAGFVIWSPDSQTILIFTLDDLSTNHYSLYVISRSGQLINHTQLFPDFLPLLIFSDYTIQGIVWSPDRKYVYLRSGNNTAEGDHKLDILTFTGEPVLSEPISLVQAIWSAQPHTLLYLANVPDQPRTRRLYSLDVASGVTTLLIDNIPALQLITFPPDRSAASIFARSGENKLMLHILSLDLTQHIMPFKAHEGSGFSSVTWSPDSQHVVVSYKADNMLTVKWVHKDSGEVKIFTASRADTPDQYVHASWWNNDIIFLIERENAGVQETWWSLNTRNMSMRELYATTLDSDAHIAWQNDDYFAINAPTSLTLYRLSNGATLFSDLPSDNRKLEFFIAPDEDATLISRNRGYTFGDSILTLVTDNAHQIVNNTDAFIQPAWTTDGAAFAFAERNTSNWVLNIMSRDGNVLHQFNLPAYTIDIAYEYVRWTTCD